MPFQAYLYPSAAGKQSSCPTCKMQGLNHTGCPALRVPSPVQGLCIHIIITSHTTHGG